MKKRLFHLLLAASLLCSCQGRAGPSSSLEPEEGSYLLYFVSEENQNGAALGAQLCTPAEGADPVDAARAGLLHDITKALDGPLQLTLCQGYGTMLDAFSQENPKTLHALTGSLVAERIFGENPAVVRAIRSHTTGMPHMNTLDKIIYVADYMEPNRDFPGVEELRHLAVTDLDGALRRGLEMTISVLQQEGKTVSPESAQTLAWLNEQK